MGHPFDVDRVVQRWQHGQLSSEQLPEIARDALEAGFDTPSLRELAWLVRPPLAEAEPLFRRALNELGRFSMTIEEQPLSFAVDLAQRILVREVGVIAGCREMTMIRNRGRLHDDRLLDPFAGVDSETEALPVGPVRELWSEDALREADLKIAQAEAAYRDFVEMACRALIGRGTTAGM
jgi:hypothetical protein